MDSSGSDSNSRRWARYEIDCRVKIFYTRDGKRNVIFGRAQDMSFGGMLLTVPLRFNCGERLELEFMPPNMPEVLKLDGVVRQQMGEYSYGVEFRNVTENQKKLVERMFEVLHVLKSLEE